MLTEFRGSTWKVCRANQALQHSSTHSLNVDTVLSVYIFSPKRRSAWLQRFFLHPPAVNFTVKQFDAVYHLLSMSLRDGKEISMYLKKGHFFFSCNEKRTSIRKKMYCTVRAQKMCRAFYVEWKWTCRFATESGWSPVVISRCLRWCSAWKTQMMFERSEIKTLVRNLLIVNQMKNRPGCWIPSIVMHSGVCWKKIFLLKSLFVILMRECLSNNNSDKTIDQKQNKPSAVAIKGGNW